MAGTTTARLPEPELRAASPAMVELLDHVRRFAASSLPVLIQGETGSGKELTARAIHANSPSAAGPWVDINCAALPDHLAESELFGYERGAFSGADSSKPGLFELANGGTLFLDEIGELAPALQGKLLRVLDRMEYYRLGGTRKVQVRTRVVAARYAGLLTSGESEVVRFVGPSAPATKRGRSGVEYESAARRAICAAATLIS